MKKIISLILCTIAVLWSFTASAESDVSIVVDGNKIQFPDQGPVIFDGRTMVPIRSVMEALGMQVGWDAENSMVTVSNGESTVKLAINSNIMINEATDIMTGEVMTFESELEVAPLLINDRTCLPIRAVVEAFGIAVSWDEETRSVMIMSDIILC